MAQGAPPRLRMPGHNRPINPGAPNGDVNAELPEGRRQLDWDPSEQHRRGPLFPLDPRAGIVHADGLSRDLQPLLRRGDSPLEGGRAQGHRLGVLRIA